MIDDAYPGYFITDDEFCDLIPQSIYHRQLEPFIINTDEHRSRHILFRKSFQLDFIPKKAILRITADDYFKLYINGSFVVMGPCPGFHFAYPYLTVDITSYLQKGKNVLAVHTYYQGLINRVWQSGDLRHGLYCDLSVDGEYLLYSDESFLTAVHDGYRETGVSGYKTQVLEEYNSGAKCCGFVSPDFDDSSWQNARIRRIADWNLIPQISHPVVLDAISPVLVCRETGSLYVDFGAMYVGYLSLKVTGEAGIRLRIRCGQELEPDGSLRYKLRANSLYDEDWILSGNEDTLDWFDYKSFRYAWITWEQDDGGEINLSFENIALLARHAPFALVRGMRSGAKEDKELQKVWDLCVHSQKYGTQEAILDCMEREKGFYLGDGCYTAFTHLLLTGDDSIARLMIEEAFQTVGITGGMVTCLGCSFMQEIAEYPLMLVYLIWWHYKITGDRGYLSINYPKVISLLENYRYNYEKNGLLTDLDKWCVVEWPANYRDGYDVDIEEGKICHTPHVVLNAYYLEAIDCANKIAAELGLPVYRKKEILLKIFLNAFYNTEKGLFRDSLTSEHISLIGNIAPFAFRLFPFGEESVRNLIEEKGVASLSLFTTFLLHLGLARREEYDTIDRYMKSPGCWLRMIREGATATFEGWGKDSKWNTSLFHMTFSYGAAFLADADLKNIFS